MENGPPWTRKKENKMMAIPLFCNGILIREFKIIKLQRHVKGHGRA